MPTRKKFMLPDLGEGLPDATVVEWFVAEGAVAKLDEPLVAMETAKAVVEVPSPCSGTLKRTGGGAGAVIATGSLLAEFELDPNLPQRAEGHDTGHHGGHAGAGDTADDDDDAAGDSPSPPPPLPSGEGSDEDGGGDAGTVVGAMQASSEVRSEATVAVGGIKAMPAVRALARKLGVDLTRVKASGPDGSVSLGDVKSAASGATELKPLVAGQSGGGQGVRPEQSSADRGSEAARSSETASERPHASAEPSPQPRSRGERGSSTAAPALSARTALSASGKPLRTQPPGVSVSGQPEQLTGVRRNMARVMADAHAKVVPTTLCDDADIDAWTPGNDITVRLLRAIVVAARAEPALNAWFDGSTLTRTLHPQVDVGLAVDTPDGLFVPNLRNADMLDAAGLREAVNRLSAQVQSRSLPASELTGYTISLSNFGKFAGRYATPVVVPPCVAIVAAGRGRHQVVPTMGGIATHRIVPLSLTFDHRACTGGEAARFLRALLDDLALPT